MRWVWGGEGYGVLGGQTYLFSLSRAAFCRTQDLQGILQGLDQLLRVLGGRTEQRHPVHLRTLQTPQDNRAMSLWSGYIKSITIYLPKYSDWEQLDSPRFELSFSTSTSTLLSLVLACSNGGNSYKFNFLDPDDRTKWLSARRKTIG